MSKSRVFVYCCLGFALGISIASYLAIPLPILTAGLFLVLVVMAVSYRPNSRNRLAIASFFCAMMILGAIRLQMSFSKNQFQAWFNIKQEFEAVVVSDITTRDNRKDFTVRPVGFSQHILVSVLKSVDVEYADRALVLGKIQEAKVFDDFDYKAYLERHQTYAIARYPKVIVLKKHQANFFVERLLRIRQSFVNRITLILPEPQASLLLGILLGARKTLPDEVIDNFNNTGISHIIAISGYNITIIVSSLERLARWLGRRVSFWLCVGVIVSFVVITGASASVVRAAIMGGLLLLSFSIGRLYAIGPALCCAAALMLLINPRILYWDVGFQLSFLATVGLMAFLPLFERLTETWPNPIELKTILLSTFSVMLTTLPLILVQFSRLSVVAPLANILVLPAVPLTMLLGFLTVLPIVGWGFGLLSRWLLSYMLTVSSWLAGWQFASVKIDAGPSLFLGLSCFIGLFYLLLRWRVDRRSAL